MGVRSAETGRALESELQWMVFKVKQRANVDYYKKRLVSVGTDSTTGFEFSMGGVPVSLEDIKFSYNWPYDYFSLVEFANIESEVTFENPPSVPNESYLPELTTNQHEIEVVADEETETLLSPKIKYKTKIKTVQDSN